MNDQIDTEGTSPLSTTKSQTQRLSRQQVIGVAIGAIVVAVSGFFVGYAVHGSGSSTIPTGGFPGGGRGTGNGQFPGGGTMQNPGGENLPMPGGANGATPGGGSGAFPGGGQFPGTGQLPAVP